MKEIFLLIVLVLLLQLLLTKKEHMNNVSNKILHKNLNNNNNILKEIDTINEDEIVEDTPNTDLNIIKYPESSNNFITIPSVEDAIYGSRYIDDAHGLLLGYLNQELSDEELKRIQGNVKTLNVKNVNKFFNPSYYRFAQPYFDFQNINDYTYTPNYKIEKNYLKN